MTREDIIADATALVDRAEIALPGVDHPVILGFRSNGALSVFWGDNEVFHFNANGELRRGYWKDRLLKCEGGNLVALRRQKTPDSTNLIRTELGTDETREVLESAALRLQQIGESIEARNCQLLREVAASDGALPRFADWLNRFGRSPIVVARRPNV